MKEVVKKLRQALSKIITYADMLGYYIFSWEIEETLGLTPTMGTDYKKLYYNPLFLEKLNSNEIAAVVIHEIVHCIFLHPTELNRAIMQRYHLPLWIMAEETVTNLETIEIIKGSKSNFELPGNPVSPVDVIKGQVLQSDGIYYYDTRFTGKTVKEVYEELLKIYNEQKEKGNEIVYAITGIDVHSDNGGQTEPVEGKVSSGQQTVNCPVCGGEVKDGQCTKCGKKVVVVKNDVIPSDAKKGDLRDEIEKAIVVMQKLLQRGLLPVGMQRYLKKLQEARIPWNRILLNFIGTIVRGADDIRWEMPDLRNPLCEEVIYPSFCEQHVDDIIFVVDTSGSMTDRQLEQIASELVKVAQYVDEAIVITTDAEIQEKVKVRDLGNILKRIKFKGGGGTDFRPLFKEVKKCAAMVFFTDGCAEYPETPPRYPVLWILTQEHNTPPFGRVAYIYDDV